MTITQAAKKWGTSQRSVSRWIAKKKIPAERITNGNKQRVWWIPDDTPCPCQNRVASSGAITPALEQRVLRNSGKSGYVKRFAGHFSIWHMAQFLQTTPAEVRTIYDDIVSNGGF